MQTLEAKDKLTEEQSRDDELRDPRLAALKPLIREVPDFPKPGIMFKDITPLLGNADSLRTVTELLAERAARWSPQAVVAIESRGFIFGASLAARLGVGMVPVRKPGKLPSKIARISYELEYGTDSLEIHADALKPGTRALVIDDLLATGGTAAATARLVESVEGCVVGCMFVIELAQLGGRNKLHTYDVQSLLRY